MPSLRQLLVTLEQRDLDDLLGAAASFSQIVQRPTVIANVIVDGVINVIQDGRIIPIHPGEQQ